jgi:hypothetical protein
MTHCGPLKLKTRIPSWNCGRPGSDGPKLQAASVNETTPTSTLANVFMGVETSSCSVAGSIGFSGRAFARLFLRFW